ncbi:hypothetical protein [Bythopirellula goksoeyrii]|uniref:Uncharacterized protein n=1 Tax=Bythopirellula goksoeyrii TaxID=1400387 RepID=A0A5B9QMR9_9BACT|nr:hypothetical protein [Bythopirellula goksoeyrii]QEG35293.1 hypothetical protein Pr1d_25890 [Bythopirellula goksoeyrii]
MTSEKRYRRFRAPVANGHVLCEPAWETLVEAVKCRRKTAELDEIRLFGIPLSKLSVKARKSILSAAQAYTGQYFDAETSLSLDGPLIVTGHQPELFHPGVWYKKFSASRLADACGGTAISLIIDSDICRSSDIRVPTGEAENPMIESVAFDKLASQVPYEERLVLDRQAWETFGERVTDTISPLVGNPLIREWWPTVVASNSKPNVGIAFSQARHRLEHTWGAHSWELPQSKLCQTETFRLFALHLFAHAADFRTAYNCALKEYRTSHRLRNRAHPVPDLHSKEDWVESPFWIWNTADPVRRSLFVRSSARGCQLTDRHAFHETLPMSLDSDPNLASSMMAEWESRGIKLRTRALTTTLFVRLLLADVFIHGIGGAKYDQVTDELCRDFFGLSLPHYATVSGTLRLPVERTNHDLPSAPEIRQKIRNLTYHPERQLEHMQFGPEDQSRIKRLVDTKNKWVRTAKTPMNAATRHEEITAVNYQLQEWLIERKQHLEQEIAQSKQESSIAQILDSREYSYCLFPGEQLKEFLLR